MRIYIVYFKGLYKYDLEYISTAEKMPGASAPGIEQKWDMKRDNILRIFSEFQRSTFGFFCFLLFAFISIDLLLCALRPSSTELTNPLCYFGSWYFCFCSSLNSPVKGMQIIFWLNSNRNVLKIFHTCFSKSFFLIFSKLSFFIRFLSSFPIPSVSHMIFVVSIFTHPVSVYYSSAFCFCNAEIFFLGLTIFGSAIIQMN